MAGVYIHIPFCVRKCSYCDFVSFPENGMLPAYVDALIKEITLTSRVFPKPPSVDTVFIGGGTPSLLSPKQLGSILDAVRDCYRLEPDAECSMESNPGTVTLESLEGYRHAGINRLSIGAQTMDGALLKRIGRIHTPLQFVDAVRFAHKAGFTNINVDVMHGLPGQTEKTYLATLSDVCDLDIQHISAYSLILEEGTSLYDRVRAGEETLPDPDAVADMQDAGIQYLAESRFQRYEISNFARDGFRCRHNLNYWNNGEYLGFGLAAHSAFRHKDWTRWSNVTCLTDYFACIRRGKRPTQETIRLYPADELFETVMLGFRKIDGIDNAVFHARFGVTLREAYPAAMAELEKRCWLLESPARTALNECGLDLQNEALLLFMK